MPRTPLVGSVLAKQTMRSAIGAARDPGLASVQDPAVTVPDGAGLHAEDIRTRSGLAGGVGPKQPAIAQAGQVALFLSLGAESEHRHGDRPYRGTRPKNQARVGTTIGPIPRWPRQSLPGLGPARRIRQEPANPGCRTAHTAGNPRARTRRVFRGSRLPGRPALHERTAWPRRTNVAASPRRQNPSPRPSRLMLLVARFREDDAPTVPKSAESP